ncbi:BTAD domain-containing putative transcriptional regulator [Actinocorallia longicatena]|uniref:BTAD domain-containing putative transcriptional regulator n=1 Tax=Actinocorallia longicatena TaxID=111803 RepID=A0ABP6QAK5_9ACTN
MEADLAFRLFGPVEVASLGDRTTALTTPKQRAVLTLLALEPGQVVPVDRLVDELWADEAPASATGTLQAYVSQLRRLLEPGRAPRTPPSVLVTRDPGYLLAVAPERVDLVRFASLAEQGAHELAAGGLERADLVLGEALGLWRGEPLAEFAGQAFAQPVIARCVEQRAVALEHRYQARLALGRAAESVGELERHVAAHPYRERLWGLLVLALYRSGRQADALGALRRVRELLDTELGLEPGPELRRLEAQVFAQSRDLDLGDPAGVPAAEPVLPARTLVGRAVQLDRIAGRLAAARRGEGGVVLVAGEGGIGKSRLVQAAAEEAGAAGTTVAWGRCADDIGAPPFWPWQQVLRALGRAGALAADPGGSLFDLHARAVEALTDRDEPLLVVLEDLHWADAASLRLLAFAAGALGRAPVVLLATLRRPEPAGDPEQLAATLGVLAREHSMDRIDLPPFTREQVVDFLGGRDASAAGELHEKSGGNPFFLGELVRLLHSEHRLEGVPDGVREVIDRRVARLPEPTRHLLRCTAVLGREVSFDTLAGLGGLPGEEVLEWLEPAVAAGMLNELSDGLAYRFSHPLVRDALYAQLSRVDKARTHLRAGLTLEAMSSFEGAGRLPALARHFGLASRVGGAAKAVEYAVLAARQAAAQHAYDEAVGYWEKALTALGPADPGRRCGLLVGLGGALRDASDTRRARTVLREAITDARRLGDHETLLEAVSILGGVTTWNWTPYGQVDEELVAVLRELLAEDLPPGRRCVLLGTLAAELNYSDRRDEAEKLLFEAQAIARSLDDPMLLVQSLNVYIRVFWRPERMERLMAAVREMLGVPGLPPGPAAIAHVHRMGLRLRLGDVEGFERDLLRASQLAAEARSPELALMARISEAPMRLMQGRWEEVRAIVKETRRIYERASLPGLFPAMLMMQSQIPGHSPDLIEMLVAEAESAGEDPLRPVTVLAVLEAGDERRARELITRWGSAVPDDWTTGIRRVVWGRVAARIGIPDPRALYEQLLPTADLLTAFGAGVLSYGSTRLTLAELARRIGDLDAARSHAAAAHEIHTRLGLAHSASLSGRLLSEVGVTLDS